MLKWGTARDRAAFSFFAERGFGANRGFVTRRFNTADDAAFLSEKTGNDVSWIGQYSKSGHVVHPTVFCHNFVWVSGESKFPGPFAVPEKTFKNDTRVVPRETTRDLRRDVRDV